MTVLDSDLVKGTVIRVPGSGRSRPFCLEIVSRDPVSKETGAVVLVGKVLDVNGITTRKRPLFRSVVVFPDRITIVKQGTPVSGAVPSQPEPGDPR